MTPRHGDLHPQVNVMCDGTEGVQRGATEDGVVLVGHVDDIEGDDLCPQQGTLKESYSQGYLAQGHHGPAPKPISGMPGGDSRYWGIIILSNTSANKRFVELPLSIRSPHKDV